MLNPVEDYELTLKIEIVKERGANLLSRLYRYQDSQGISIDDESNPWILMSDDLSGLDSYEYLFSRKFLMKLRGIAAIWMELNVC